MVQLPKRVTGQTTRMAAFEMAQHQTRADRANTLLLERCFMRLQAGSSLRSALQAQLIAAQEAALKSADAALEPALRRGQTVLAEAAPILDSLSDQADAAREALRQAAADAQGVCRKPFNVVPWCAHCMRESSTSAHTSTDEFLLQDRCVG